MAKGKLAPGEAHERIAEIEQRGDAMRAELVTRLSGVLVAPIDREDLFRLSRSIDDVLDNLRDFVRAGRFLRRPSSPRPGPIP